ncbi:energy transducer TonB [Sphingomonas panacisoli]|uniref:energy transducer TonB n=1 Tax=Sphingomonas panacisoli TaxID=1813879 RepID=UPI001646B02A|nr:energy transducer TonB [Sphingomonas panacisoli]
MHISIGSVSTAIMIAAGFVALAVPSVAMAQEATASAHPKGDLGSWFPMNIYPPEAKRKGEQGRVVAELAVDKFGNATACKIVQSSGSMSLDARTCELALANARFVPALDTSGKPVASTFTLPGVRWVLNDVFTVDLSTGGTSSIISNFEIDVDPQGNGVACRPVGVTQGLGGCADFKPGKRVTAPLIRNNKPVAGTVTIITTMRVDPK